MHYMLICADCPWNFSDQLRQSDVKRGSAANYKTLPTKDLMQLDVKSIVADQAVLALWCPSSMFEDGFAVGRAWGFDKYVGIWTWVKRNPLEPKLARYIRTLSLPPDVLDNVCASGKFAFGMGHVFRGATEHALIFRRGKKLKVAEHRRNVYVGPSLPLHSQKPEKLQDDLDVMYPEGHRLELFARRFREGDPAWDCTGIECDGLDAREAIEKAKEWA